MLTVSVDPPPPHLTRYGQLIVLFCCALTPDNDHMCSETDFSQENFRMIIYKRLVSPDYHLQPRNVHKNAFLRPFQMR